MKKNKLSIICSLMIVPLLMSASSYTSVFKSNVKGGNVTAVKKLSEGSNSGECLSNVLNNVAARITFTYELYKMYKRTETFANYVDSYTLIYRVNIYLNNNVHYKGGVFNMFDGHNPAYLKNIRITSTFNSLKNIQKYNISPENSNGTANLREVNPYYEDYPTEYNYLYGMTRNPLQTNSSIAASSYDNELNNDIAGDKWYVFDSRISAGIVNKENKADTSLTIEQNFLYNYKVDPSLTNPYDSIGVKVENEMYSGPDKDARPFNFAFYGSINFESESEPKNSNIKVYMNTNHGSTVALDKFSSSTTLNFKF